MKPKVELNTIFQDNIDLNVSCKSLMKGLIKMQLNLQCIIGMQTEHEEECYTSLLCQMWPHLHACTACCSTASGSSCLATGGLLPWVPASANSPMSCPATSQLPTSHHCSPCTSGHQPCSPAHQEVYSLLSGTEGIQFFCSKWLMAPPASPRAEASGAHSYVGPAGSSSNALGSVYGDNKSPGNPTSTLKPNL